MRKDFSRTLIALACLCAASARSGELRLVNGAVIPGELEKLEATRLVWRADLVGKISVERASVLSMDSSAPLSLRAEANATPLEDCRLHVASPDAALECKGQAALQVPFAAVQAPPPEHESTGKLAVALKLERGSGNTDELDASGRSSRRIGKRRHSFEGSIDYEETRSRTSEDEADLMYQADYLLREGWYVYGRTEYYRDREATVQETLAIGLGAGRDMRPLPDLLLQLQAGINEVDLEIDEQGSFRTEAGTVRWRGTWKTPWWKTELFHEGNFDWALERSEIYRLETHTGLNVPLMEGLVGELRVDWDRYGLSPDGESNRDIEWVLALGYRW